MTDLEEAFGEEFVEKFQQERQRRRAERERIEDEEMAKICALAVNEGKMEAQNPMFTYVSDSGITHDVALITVPDPEGRSYWSLKNDGEQGSVQLPLEYMGEWIWCWFNDRDIAKKLEPGEDFIVAGRLDTWERDDGTEQDQFSPVRGVAHISQVKEWADMALEEDGFEVPEQPGDEEPAVLEDSEEEDSTDELDESETEGTMFGSSDEDMEEDVEDDSDEDEEGTFSELLEEKEEVDEENENIEEEEEKVPYDDVEDEVYNLAENEDRVWDVDEEKPALLDKLVNMIGNRLDYETNEEGAIKNSDIAEEIRSHSLNVIEEHNEAESVDEKNLF